MKEERANEINPDPDSSEILRREIQEQSEKEVEGILEQAGREVGRVLSEARAEAEKSGKAVRKAAESRAEAVRKRILSGVHLEVKRQELRAREDVVARILSSIGERWEDMRGTKEYVHVLEQFVAEGVSALDGDAFRIEAGEREGRLLTKAVMAGIVRRIEESARRTVSLSLGEKTLTEGGVVIVAADGRTHFDNRFSARMARQRDRMRLEIAKRLFESNV